VHQARGSTGRQTTASAVAGQARARNDLLNRSRHVGLVGREGGRTTPAQIRRFPRWDKSRIVYPANKCG
jgi:hypothetical protein